MATPTGSILSPKPGGVLTSIVELLGISRTTTGTLVGLCAFLGAAAVGLLVWTAPPRTIIMTSGPEGSVFHTNALRYARLLAEHRIRIKVLTSHGSQENLDRLTNPKMKVDVGFVLGGVTNSAMDSLMSLGSVSYQPLLVFYRGEPLEHLSGLAGRRLAVGPIGSGTRSVALAVLDANGIKPTNTTTFLDSDAHEAAKALLQGTADAVFLMGEDAPVALLRELLRAPDIHLLSFRQALAYTRRITYLNVLELPEGSIDLGKNVPPVDIHLVGPTVELIARDTLHPALSDLLLEAAREVHGRAGLLQRKGEFPAPLEQEIRLSPDALRFYRSGKTFFYRYLPFWLAALITRVVVVFVPMALVLIPIVRSAPRIYSWRVRSRIYRWYRALLVLEREWLSSLDPLKRDQLLTRLDEIEKAVNKLKVPAFAADLYYDLRGHIGFVRQLLNRLGRPGHQQP
jgi:hypothetical protein